MSAAPREPERPDEAAPLFSNLLASRPPREGRSAAAATATSVLGHAVAVALLVYATMAIGQEVAEEEEQVTLIEIPEEVAPPPPPPPPPADAPPPTMTDIPKGFQTLTVPEIIPPEIPPPAQGPEITEADFSGEGVEGGRADGKVVTADNVEVAPTFTPYTVAPELRNIDEVRRALERGYPPLLRDAGIGGTVLVWILIDEEGRALKTQVQKSSGHEPLDRAALEVGGIMRFTPALNRDQKVKVWVALPITYTAR